MAVESLPEQWTEGLDALVLSSPVSRDAGSPMYPRGTLSLMKELREKGIRVDYAYTDGPHPELGFFSEDWIMPIIVFSADAVTRGAVESLLAILFERLLKFRKDAKQKEPTMRIRCGRAEADKVEWFEGDGPAEEVLQALRRTLK